MVLGDYIRRLFSKNNNDRANNNGNDPIGITGLPRSIEDDLAKHSNGKFSENRKGLENEHEDELNRTFPDFSLYIGPHYHEKEYDDISQIEHNMMRQLEEMMNSLFSGFQMRDFVPDVPQIEGPMVESPEDDQHGHKSLRDEMLKNPERSPSNDQYTIPIKPFQDNKDDDHSMMGWSWTYPFGNGRQRGNMDELRDRDFDEELLSGKSRLDDILERRTEERPDIPEKSRNGGLSFQQFSSITTRKRADGIIESQKTVRDSQGNEEVTVIRKIGDQEHKTTTKKDSCGNEETKEDLVNMNEGDLEKFEDAWIRSRTNDGLLNSPTELNSDLNTNWNLSGNLNDIIKEFFFPWKRS